MIDILIFEDSLKPNVINDLNATAKFIISLIFLAGIFVETQFFPLLILYMIILSIVGVSQGFKSVFSIYWHLKYYIVLIVLITLVFEDFEVNQNIMTIFLKLISVFISFALFSKSTSPERFTDVLIQLKVPVSIAWSIGVAFRQAILLLEDVYFIQAIQRIRNSYRGMKPSSKLIFRVKEVYTMLISLLGRSIIISTEFAVALKMRGWKKAHKDIILQHSPLKNSDYVAMVLVLFVTLTIILTL